VHREKRPSMKLRKLVFAVVMLAGCGSSSDLSGFVNQVPPPNAGAASFIDPTSRGVSGLTVGKGVFVAPFARIQLNGSTLHVGDYSDVQDNVSIEADSARRVQIGDQVILAHGCTVVGPSVLGAAGAAPVFVGFNAKVEGASMEPNSMVSPRARLAPGLVLHSGKRVLPGRNVTTQQEADDIALGKVVDVLPGDVAFMKGVLTVNIDLAAGYEQLAAEDPSAVLGIGPDPITPIHPEHFLPTFNGKPTRDETFPNRVVGDIGFADAFSTFASLLGRRDSIRADEGGPFAFGGQFRVDDEVTVHALEHSKISVGNNCHLGTHSVLHGGEDLNDPTPDVTQLGNNIEVGERAVVFRSTLGDNCVIGAGALLDSCTLPPGTTVPPNTILINNVNEGTITW